MRHPVCRLHEYQTTDAAPYYSYFGSALAGSSSGTSWCARTYGTWRIISVNSNHASEGSTTSCNEWCQLGASSSLVSGGLGSTQRSARRAFLRQQLNDAEAKGMGAIVMAHHPALSDGAYAPGTKLGTIQLVVGTGGRPSDAFVTSTAAYRSAAYGAVTFVLGPTSVSWALRTTTADTLDSRTVPIS